MAKTLEQLAKRLSGEIFTDELHKTIYATDGSIYRKIPLGVAYPKDVNDIEEILHYARLTKTPLIPRTAGTSLAGQCVGEGLVVDVSKYFNKILELNVDERWVIVQPGVIRDELNAFLLPHGLFFGPNTSTANRCMLGGMVGNNSSGTTSIKYSTTRDHVLELKVFLSDGSQVIFRDLTKNEFFKKTKQSDLEGQIYRQIWSALSQPGFKNEIEKNFPKPTIHRRNTGYAIDILHASEIFSDSDQHFNFCRMLAGSEGTLAFTTEIKLSLDPLPPPFEMLICAHFYTLREALYATLEAMRHQPYGCELMDKTIMDCTKENREQEKNRFFLKGDPGAVLIIELRADQPGELERKADILIADIEKAGLGYAFPKVYPPKTKNVAALRAAGFGVLSNVRGDAKPIEFVEDTAVDLPDLPDYIAEFEKIMENFGQKAVYYAHAGAGELHIRPAVNLKTTDGLAQLRAIAEQSARLVKKYRGSLSGEHGDGRVRGEFIKFMFGEKIYSVFKEIKHTWDPDGIFNPGKIVDAAPMDTDIRYLQDAENPHFSTIFNFEEGSILKLAEKCSGSGDCRKLAEVSGGLMCPSYMATRDEKDTTRARANVLRELLTRQGHEKNVFAKKELAEVMDLCLSCKGCASECPSNVDMALLKAEYLYQRQRVSGVPFRAKFFGNISTMNALAARLPGFSNFILQNKITAGAIKKVLGIAPERSFPKIEKSLKNWFRSQRQNIVGERGKVLFFCDEFTNYNDTEAGKKAILLLQKLGYSVEIPAHFDSGRAQISKGLLLSAKKLAEKNLRALEKIVTPATPLVGLEPSAVLTFRDEYPKLVNPEFRKRAQKLAENVFLLEEFLCREVEKSNIKKDQFSGRYEKIYLHGHCHQKALASVESTARILSLPENFHVELIPSGCCGMAGSFGYEKEHYEVSMKIGELVLFPAVRKAGENDLIAAPGTSCRHQILDGAGRTAYHPAEILFDALL